MAGYFWQRLQQGNPSAEGRRWLYLPYDQLSLQLGPLGRCPPQELAVILIENPAKAARRPYHKQKLAWVLCHMRQFALELIQRGVHVSYRIGGYAECLQSPNPGGRIDMAEAAEFELRQELEPLIEANRLKVNPHEGWLTTSEQFLDCPRPWRMDQFYRKVRQQSGILMEQGKPLGGRYSFDGENRQSWKGQPAAPTVPRYPPCPLRLEVGELIERRFSHHPGKLDLGAIPLTSEEIEHFWNWAKSDCLPSFGPYEDAMSTHSSGLFHSRISPLLNLQRLTPARVVAEVLELPLKLASKEGFVRQILGWREFVRHVHHQTRGFRDLEEVNWLGAQQPLPPAFWGKTSGLACLDHVVADVWREGWSHHITRLMVLSNLASLLDCSPRELCDWFWVAYIDAFDWVVEPNVLGMGAYALGPLMTTKPYISGSGYIHKMSDYCGQCRFNPRSDCPLTSLYWAYLGRHRQRLDDNPRLLPVLRNWDRRSPSAREQDQATFERVSQTLQAGEELRPSLP